MSDILAEINEHKWTEIAALKQRYGLGDLSELAAEAGAPRGFEKRLAAASIKGYGLIAELKKASPSRGLIRADFDPPALAEAYASGGASCLSVLTDQRWFQGDAAYLSQARAACNLPVLRKDFMLDPYQVFEARAMGADCILLIMASLSTMHAAELEAAAFELGMDVLIETHDERELERALELKSKLLGINNRNLKTMEISLDVGAAMLPFVPADRIAVVESGLFTADDLATMAEAGARCFLIGEALMRAEDVANATKTILSNPAHTEVA